MKETDTEYNFQLMLLKDGFQDVYSHTSCDREINAKKNKTPDKNLNEFIGIKKEVECYPCGFFFFFFADGVVAEIERKITEAFEAFDHEGSETVDVRFVNVFT